MQERRKTRNPRTRRTRRHFWVAAFALSVALGGAVPAQAENAVLVGAGKAVDLIVVRPLTLGQLAFGAICFVPSALFAGKAIGEPWETFVRYPFEATFLRPLGEFEDDY